MKRKIYDELRKWKEESNGKNAILIDGARRVGKIKANITYMHIKLTSEHV